MTRTLITNENGADSLKPQSQTYEPQGRVAADAQGRADDGFGYGGTPRIDGSPDQDRPRDERTYPSRQNNRQGRAEADFEKMGHAGHPDWNQSPNHDTLTKWTLSQLSQGGRPAEPAADVKSPGFENFQTKKEKAAADIAKRAGLEKDALDGKDYGATDFDLDKPDLRAKNQGYERRGY